MLLLSLCWTLPSQILENQLLFLVTKTCSLVPLTQMVLQGGEGLQSL